MNKHKWATWNRADAVGIPTTAALPSPVQKLGDTYYVGTDGNGLWSSTDGLNWSRALGINNNAAFDHPPTEFNGTYYVGQRMLVCGEYN